MRLSPSSWSLFRPSPAPEELLAKPTLARLVPQPSLGFAQRLVRLYRRHYTLAAIRGGIILTGALFMLAVSLVGIFHYYATLFMTSALVYASAVFAGLLIHSFQDRLEATVKSVVAAKALPSALRAPLLAAIYNSHDAHVFMTLYKATATATPSDPLFEMISRIYQYEPVSSTTPTPLDDTDVTRMKILMDMDPYPKFLELVSFDTPIPAVAVYRAYHILSSLDPDQRTLIDEFADREIAASYETDSIDVSVALDRICALQERVLPSNQDHHQSYGAQ